MSPLTRVLSGSMAVLALLAGSAASADVTIIGALSNFDCPNNTPEVCDEFEIEFEGPHPEDCTGFWGNYNYGQPTMRAKATNTGIIVNYRRAGRSTQIGAIEHFGVHLRNFSVITSRVFRWKHNGVVVTSGSGLPPVPIPNTTVVPNPNGGENVREEVENESPDEVIWVRRKVIAVPREVALAELMPNDPLILAAVPLENELEKLEPGEVLVNEEPIELTDDTESQVIVIETYSDVPTWNAATQSWDHAPGDLMSRAMNATVTQNPGCADLPVITQQPDNLQVLVGGAANMYITATSPATAGDTVYLWRHNGLDLPLQDNPRLEIDPVTPADVGAYTCLVTNDCGRSETMAAWITLCKADFNVSGSVSVQDVFAYLAAYFSGDPAADFNDLGGTTVQDIFDFLAAYFLGCP